MLISFSLENWTSFRDQVTFSMVASRERQHGGRVPRLDKYKTRVLPIAALYGGNASGKSNFFKALVFAQRLVTEGIHLDSRIPVEPFRLDPIVSKQPSRFRFELLIDELIYEFSFAVTSKEVLEERLVEITSTRERVLYDRREGKLSLDDALTKEQEQGQFLKFVFRGTRGNQLFLTNSVSQNFDVFRPVHDWFKSTLTLIAPDASFGSIELFLENPLHAAMNERLPQLDTGITRLGYEEVPIESLALSEYMETKLQEDVKEGKTVRVSWSSSDQFIVTRRGGELIVKKMMTYHQRADGTEAKFEIHQESDGSQRVIDLLPAFCDLSDQNSRNVVYVIDEIDRSLHTLLTRSLLEAYLATCSANTRNQLLLTTHDVLLMDQQLLRRDEIWVCERDALGVSQLISFSDYKEVRHDKDLRKSYLQGRLGGIPRILL